MKKSLVTTLLLFFVAVFAFGQNPPMPSQERDAEKDALYGTFSGNKRLPGAEQQRIAYEAAREYLRKFGQDNDPEVVEVRKYVAEYQKVMREQDLQNSLNAKHYDDTFRLGRQIIEHEPENFFALALTAEAGLESARAGNAKSKAETIDYLRRAIKLLDADKNLKPKPFESVGMAQGFLNAGLGSLLKDESPVEAAAAFLSAAKSDSPFRTDPIIYHRLGTATLKGEFARLSAEYNQKFGNKESSPEQRALLERLTRVAARAIDAYARAAALSTSPNQQEEHIKILEQLTSLYKGFHNNSDVGLKELIDTVLARPMPGP